MPPDTANRERDIATVALVAVCLAALLLRLYRLGCLPDGLFCDEAANGYDAFLILTTGRDLTGRFLPLHFCHHGIDWPEGLYTYLAVPCVGLFGLTEVATRLPAAIAGALLVPAIWLLGRELFDQRVGLVAAFLMAFSPWALPLSRVGFRAILAPLFLVLSAWLLLVAIRRRALWIPCGLAFGLSLHTYTIAKFATPALLVVFLIGWRREILAALKASKATRVHAILGAVSLVLMATGAYWRSFFGHGADRFSDITVMNAARPFYTLALNVAAHLTPSFLFFDGDANLRHSLPGHGQTLLAAAPFALIAVALAFTRRRSYDVCLIAFLIGLVPAALTNDGVPHAPRAIAAMPFWELLAASGVVAVSRFTRRRGPRVGVCVAVLIASALLVSAVTFTRDYFVHYPRQSRDWFQHGMSAAIEEAQRLSSGDDRIIVSPYLTHAYIFPLFYARERYRVRSVERLASRSGRYLFIGAPDDARDCEEVFLVRDVDGVVRLRLARVTTPD